MTQTPTDTSAKKSEDTTANPAEDYGYVFYPKRAGAVGLKERSELLFPVKKRFFLFQKATDFYAAFEHNKCLYYATRSFYQDPFIKLLVAALEVKGCPVNPKRHISCEPCHGPLNGGFDYRHCQVALCQKKCKNERTARSVLRHELIHAFDFCRASLDHRNSIDHIACTEIRAANFLHCDYFTAAKENLISPFNFVNEHKNCVKERAFRSVRGARDVSEIEAREAVDRVFDRCYADLEPFGMRPVNDEGNWKAYRESRFYGYRKLHVKDDEYYNVDD